MDEFEIELPVNNEDFQICGIEGCRLSHGHQSRHLTWPATAWGFLNSADKNKITKAGFATPRGGAKGAYQNHVDRSNKVIVPFERLDLVDLNDFDGGYVIRLFPEQCFSSPGVLKTWDACAIPIVIGENAFILYGSHKSYDDYPPLNHWAIRSLEHDGQEVFKRVNDVIDRGHYVLRIPKLGAQGKLTEGPPQGIFAPEHASKEMNYLARCVLAWLIVHTDGSPYTTTQTAHLKAVLDQTDIVGNDAWERNGVLRNGITTCPLCMRALRHNELSDSLSLDDEDGLSNAGIQVEGAMRSTVVNLFHLEPLSYRKLDHQPCYVSWGHATCNTKLGQRRCHSLEELQELNLKLGVITETGVETFGWMSEGWEFIRSPLGAVWIRISTDGNLDPATGIISN